MRISYWSSDVCSSDLEQHCRLVEEPERLAETDPVPWSCRLCFGSFRSLPADRLYLADRSRRHQRRSEEHTSELQSLMRISYAVFCLKKKNHPRCTKIADKVEPNIKMYNHNDYITLLHPRLNNKTNR